MIRKSMLLGVAVGLAMALGTLSCGKSESGRPGGAAAQVSGLEREAQNAALAEVMKHWSKAPDGWITARNAGSSFAPIEFLRQARELTVEGVREYDLSDSDRLNGFEWAGEVSFKQTPCREAGDQGIFLNVSTMAVLILGISFSIFCSAFFKPLQRSSTVIPLPPVF